MIDLHSHSIYSDGSDTPEYLAHMAGSMGLKALALTDHDTLAGLDRFLGQQYRVSTRLIPGIELSCEFLGHDLHVLGLFINHRDPTFQKRVQTLYTRRSKRNELIFQKLRDLNKKISPEALGDGRRDVLTRAHIAEMLVKAGYAAAKAEAFQKYLGEDGLAYVPFEFLSPDDAFKWIAEAGGLPVIAHPGRFSKTPFAWDRAMANLRDRGARGIEAYHSDHSEGEMEYFLWLCDKLNMIPTGGSDYHGRYKPRCKMGIGWGNLNVPDWMLDGLR